MQINDIIWKYSKHVPVLSNWLVRRAFADARMFWEYSLNFDEFTQRKIINQFGYTRILELSTIDKTREICRFNPDFFASNHMFNDIKIDDVIAQEEYLQWMVTKRHCITDFPIIFGKIHHPIIKIQLICCLYKTNDVVINNLLLEIIHSNWNQSEGLPPYEINELLTILKMEFADLDLSNNER